jgi:ATP-dependent helicase/nuclease subunit A
MSSKTFTIYRSSAGSGKTRTLAKEYLKLALQHRSDYFKHILAVTFTNKATQEMKDRILEYLDDFANNRDNELAEELKKELGFDDLTFQQYAQEARSRILHSYAQFSISTIDAFFQRVIRSFTREAGLVGDYRLEVEQDEVMEQVIDNLIDELGGNPELTKWVVDFATENLENEKAWDVRQSLLEFSREIFTEEFKAIESEVVKHTHESGFFSKLRKELRDTKYEYYNGLRQKAGEALSVLKSHGLTENDFKYKAKGSVYGFFRDVANAESIKDILKKAQGSRVNGDFLESRAWPDAATRNRDIIIKLADQGLKATMTEIVTIAKKNVQKALSAEVALSNFYSFGLLADISRKLKDYKDENNLMLLADAPKFLHGVIQDSDTPFIYEKVGSFYRNYLIDEFQDTSGLQWKNFLPLVLNGLDQGHKSLVVGDVKQAIYRWRGGDLTLLQSQVEQHIGKTRVESKELDTNYRSGAAIIDFNNKVFHAAAQIVAASTGATLPVDAYHDVSQQSAKNEKGYVSVQFVGDLENDWKQEAIDLVPQYLEQLQSQGVALKDIAILVRKNFEGQEIATHLLQYKNSDRAKPGFKYDVVSNELLRIDGATTVNLLIGALKYLLNPDDSIARAHLSFEFSKLHHPDRPLTEVFTVANQAIFEDSLPDAFTKEKAFLRKLPLIELTETLIEIFRLGNINGELVYLQAFQDQVLEFYSRERNDLGAFLEWWEIHKWKKSIKVSEDTDAVQIYTIHKSKGLQFKYVILPFCAWGIDHEFGKNPNLWVTSDEEPFNEAGYLPVRYASGLQDTFFGDYYVKEKIQAYLDNLNVVYVGFTRAEKGLFVVGPSPSVKYAKATVSWLVYQSIAQNEQLKEGWSETDQRFQSGVIEVQKKEASEHSSTPVSLVSYGSFRWRDKLVIRQSGANYFNEIDHERQERAKYGIYLHALLSQIKYADEIDVVFNRLVSEGVIEHIEKDSVYRQISELMSNPLVAPWFDHGWEVRTEAPVVLPGGKENRIDRLITKGNKAVIIDFKTGEPSKQDQRQVTEYMDILRKMNFTDVEGFLLYVKTSDVVAVNTSKVKKIKPKDINQLGIPGLT